MQMRLCNVFIAHIRHTVQPIAAVQLTQHWSSSLPQDLSSQVSSEDCADMVIPMDLLE